MAAWPGTLPLPQSDGYQIAPVDQTARTDMEFGAPRSRRRTAARNDKVTLNWQMEDAQVAIFRTWFDNPAEAAGGSAWFTHSLPIGNGGYTTQESRFVGPYKISHIGGTLYSVSAEVEVR